MQGRESANGRGRHRLVVADVAPHVSELVRRALAVDFNVMIEPNGARAVEAVGAGMPDPVLLDLEMQVMGSLEACRRLRTVCPLLPIVILTGHAGCHDE